MKKLLQKFLYKLLAVVCNKDLWLAVLLVVTAIVEYYAFQSLFEPRAANAQAPAQNITLGVNVGTGYSGIFSNSVYSYLEPNATTCQFGGTRQISVPAHATSFVVDTGALFPGFAVPVAIGLADTTPSPGQQLDVGMSTNGPRIHMAARGFITTRTASGFPVFYIDNPSLLQPGVVQVFMLGN